MTRKDPAADAAEMERRVLLAFALNSTRSMSCAELMTAAVVARRPEDEASAFERAIYALRARGTVTFHVLAAGGCQIPGVSITSDATLPAATALRRRTGERRAREDGDPRRLRRVLVVPGRRLSDAALPLFGDRADRG